MAAIVEKDWKNVSELIRWWHNRPKQIVGSEIDMAMAWAWDAAIKSAEALKPSHNKPNTPCEWYQQDEYCTHPDQCKW